MNDSLPQSMPQDNPSHKKRCTKCHLWLPFNRFGIDRGNKDGLFDWCKKCKSKQAKESLTPEKIRAQNMRRLYGISLKEYDRMFAEQGGVCYLCKQPETMRATRGEGISPLAVDHNHETGEIRMLLCHDCNTKLGAIETNLDKLDVFLGYLEEMKQREPAIKIVQLRLVD